MKLRNRLSINRMLQCGAIMCVSAGLLFATVLGAMAAGELTPGAVQPQFETKPIPTRKTPKIIIPPVVDRPLDVEEGPKIIVQDFVIDGANDYPDLGISVAEIKVIIAEEMKRYPDGITIGQLQLVANKISNYYRKNGFILAHAYISEQTVEAGVIRLSVLEGILGQIKVEGNKRYNEKILKRPFVDLVGKPLVKDRVEGALLTLMSYPGLGVTGMFTPGEQVGTADMTIKVDEEKLIGGGVSLNNYGSEYVGEFQARVDLVVNNITKAADSLQVSAMQSFEPKHMVYGALAYKRPLSKFYSLGIGASKNLFDVGRELEESRLEGVSEIGNIYLQREFIKSRRSNLKARFDVSMKDSETRRPSGSLSKDQLTVIAASVSGDCIDSIGKGGINLVAAEYSRGIGDFLGSMNSNNDPNSGRRGGSGVRAGAVFDKWNLNLSRLQRLGENTSALFRFSTQWTDDLLISLEQFPMGGPESVRAYAQSEYMRDRAYFGSMEFFFNAPGFADKPAFFNRTWGEMLQFSLFADYAEGFLNDPLPSEEKRAQLCGAGVGLRFVISDRFLATVTVAGKLGEHEPADSRSPHTYFKMSYQF